MPAGTQRMRTTLRTTFAASLLSLCCSIIPAAAEQYRLESLTFNSLGKTKPAAIRNALPPVEYGQIFDTQEAFEAYLDSIVQALENTRQLDKIRYSYTVSGGDSSGILSADATYTFTDSHSIVIVPAPSLNSNSGTQLKLVFNDSNFMGLLSPLSLSVGAKLGTESEPENFSKVTAGFDFTYTYPFSLGKTKNEWDNAFSFSWLLDSNEPEFSARSGITVGIPLGRHELDVKFAQLAARKNEYAPYGDQLYFTEEGGIFLPLTVTELQDGTPVVYTPFVSASYTWDIDGIDSRNTALAATPQLRLGHRLDLRNIQWNGNFRTGYSFSMEQSVAQNLNADGFDEMFIPFTSAEIKLFKGWSRAGIGGAFYAFDYLSGNSTANIGARLRGILDNQEFSMPVSADGKNYALDTTAAITLNMDFPIHIFTTHFAEHSSSKLLQYLDIELQVSPFLDIGLLANKATGHTFDLKEGLYAGGIEFLIFPQQWKSYTIRASVGVDASRALLDGHFGFDSSWRNPRHNYEIFIGVGNQF